MANDEASRSVLVARDWESLLIGGRLGEIRREDGACVPLSRGKSELADAVLVLCSCLFSRGRLNCEVIWFLHGALGHAGDWDEIAHAFAAEGQATRAVELWRFLECEGMSLESWAESFNAEVKAAGAEENILVGYSMGGRLGLHALLEEPSLWSRAAIVSAHPGLPDEHERLLRMASDAEWAGLALTSDWNQFLDRWSGQAVLQEFGVKSEEHSARRGKLVNRRRAIARSFMDWSLGKQQDLRPALSQLDLPLLWIAGERDEKFATLAREAVAILSRGQLEIVPSVGHRVPWEAPESFLASLRPFLAEGTA